MNEGMTPQEMIAVIKAFDEGKKIEYKMKRFPDSHWCHIPSPSWDFSQYAYRVIVPPPREVWLQEIGAGVWQEKFAGFGTHFREVLS